MEKKKELLSQVSPLERGNLRSAKRWFTKGRGRLKEKNKNKKAERGGQLGGEGGLSRKEKYLGN